MTNLIEEARAVAERLRETARPDDVADLIDRLCDALGECGYTLTGQWAARFPMGSVGWDDDLIINAGNQQAARQIVRTGREADPRWQLIHRHAGPWREVE